MLSWISNRHEERFDKCQRLRIEEIKVHVPAQGQFSKMPSVISNVVSVGSLQLATLPLSSPKTDIGFGCPVSQSSSLSEETRATVLYPSNTPGSWSFHTEHEANPQITVNLQRVRSIGEIRLWNREDAGRDGIERVVPFRISSSIDGEYWTELITWTASFGGQCDAMPFSISFAESVDAYYIKVELTGSNYLHLDYIEILQHMPKLDWGFCNNIQRSGLMFVCKYLHRFNTGLYSGCSTALHDVIRLGKSGLIATNIDLTMSFKFFKDNNDEDAYPLLFSNKSHEKADEELVHLCREVEFDCHDVHKAYKELPLADISALIEVFFRPSEEVMQTAKLLQAQSDLDPSTTIALVYRGTDKGSEVRLASIEEYIKVALLIRASNPGLKVLIQTDQEQARTRVIEAFEEDCIYFADLPVTGGDVVMHRLPDLHKSVGRTAFSTKLMAAVLLASSCQYVVLHTGNVGAWTAFYRGHRENLYQFDANGELVRP